MTALPLPFRMAGLALGAACCLAAGAAGAQAPAAPSATDPAGTPTAAQQTEYARCLAGLRRTAGPQDVPAKDFDRFTAGLVPDMTVLPLLDAQPEFKTPLWDYLAPLVDDIRIADGRARMAQHADVLKQVQQRSGVDPATVVAVWGVESDFGRIQGKRPLLVSLSTLSCFGRRQSFFQGEFMATLALLSSGDLTPDELTGSWAGAFGQTQFMPTTYRRIAVDGDGDGRRDLVRSVPDALASTANYLARAGWRSGEPWGFEVKLPVGFNTAGSGRGSKKPLREWAGRGITRVDGRTLPLENTPAALLLPTGPQGPAFITFKNFDAIYSYNAAESYALAIALLSDRLKGGGPLVTSWPTDDPPLDRTQRRQLQTLLLARGHAIGEPDGLMGALTRRAIVAEQQRLGMVPADGRAGTKILQALTASSPVAPGPASAPAR